MKISFDNSLHPDLVLSFVVLVIYFGGIFFSYTDDGNSKL